MEVSHVRRDSNQLECLLEQLRYERKIQILNIGDTFFTLMSIAQGVALGFLFLLVKSKLEEEVDLVLVEFFTSAIMFKAYAVFVIIVLVYFEYFNAIKSFGWVPGIIDALIPFLFCVAEVALIFSIDRSAEYWFYCNAAFCVLGTLAYANMYIKASTFRETINRDSLTAVGLWKYILTLLPVIIALFFGYVGLSFKSEGAATFNGILGAGETSDRNYSYLSIYIYIYFMYFCWLKWLSVLNNYIKPYVVLEPICDSCKFGSRKCNTFPE